MTRYFHAVGRPGRPAGRAIDRFVALSFVISVMVTAQVTVVGAQQSVGENDAMGPPTEADTSPRVEAPSGRYPGKVPMERRRIETLPEPAPTPEVEQQFRIPLDLFGGEKKKRRSGPADEPTGHDSLSDRSPTRRIVVLQGLDKITGRVSTFEAPLGEPMRFGSLVIVARSCNKRPPEEAPETTAFLDIYDDRPNEAPADLFSGWMFASSPALNALEHPVYDVWVASCRIESAETSSDRE